MRKIKFLKIMVGVMLVLCMVFEILPPSVPEKSTVYAYSYHTQDEALAWARNQISKGIDYDGAYGNQCVDLILAYYKYLVGYTSRGNACDYANNALPDGWTRVYGNYQPGDIAVFKTYDSKAKTGQYGHVGIITSCDGYGFNAINQNYNYQSFCTENWFYCSSLQCAIRPDWPIPAYNPIGCVDAATGGRGSVTVRGWTFDKDDWNAQLLIHVYIGGEHIGTGTANTERTDANDVYGCGAWHGFDITVPTQKTGRQHVQVYAINVGGGDNVLLWEGDVSIDPIDSEAPVFKSARVAEIDSYGYWVECEVTDNEGVDRIECEVIDKTDGDSDKKIKVSEVVYKDGIYKIRVPKTPTYYQKSQLRIWAFDASGNKKSTTLPITKVVLGCVPKKIIAYNGYLYSRFDDGLGWLSAVSYAKKMGGNLVSIENEAENDIVYSLVEDAYKYGYYIGGYCDSANGDYKWIDGSKFTYSNWCSGEPNCSDDSEFYACMPSARNGQWNDVGTVEEGTMNDMGFIVKTPLNLEESISIETDTKIYKYYDIIMPYALAKKFCEENGGYLACITSKEENELLASKIDKSKDIHNYYIGATDIERAGVLGWEWVSGEEFGYSNWGNGYGKRDEDWYTHCVWITSDESWLARDDGLRDIGAKVGFIAEFDKNTSIHQEVETPASSEKPDASTMPSENPISSSQPTQSLNPVATIEPSESQKPETLPLPNEKTKIMGDINGDGGVDLQDVQIALQAYLDIVSLSEEQEQVADINSDAIIDLQDVQKILQMYLQI